MTQKGPHTWDLVIQYHRCPKCGFIVENRENFHCKGDVWSKSVKCDRCNHLFTATKSRRKSFGPLFGDPQPIEMNWD